MSSEAREPRDGAAMTRSKSAAQLRYRTLDRTRSMPKLREDLPQRSTPLELVLSLGFLVLVCYGAFCLFHAHRLGFWVAVGLWAVCIARMHFQIWYYSGTAQFAHVARRFPHAYINTVVGFVPFNVAKLLQWIVCEMNPFFDFQGQLFTIDTRGGYIDTDRYLRAAMDLDKPLLFKRGPTYWYINVVGFSVSPQMWTNVYTVGPVAAFGVFPVVYSDRYVMFQNDLLGTHFIFNSMVMFYFNGRESFNHVKQMTLPPLSWLMTVSWENFGLTLIDVIEESEERRSRQPVPTYLGLLTASEIDALRPASLANNWNPPDAEKKWNMKWTMMPAKTAAANVAKARPEPPSDAVPDVMDMSAPTQRNKPARFCGCI